MGKSSVDVREIRFLALQGLLVEGAHHKQWFFEKILEALGTDVELLRRRVRAGGQDWVDGVAP